MARRQRPDTERQHRSARHNGARDGLAHVEVLHARLHERGTDLPARLFATFPDDIVGALRQIGRIDRIADIDQAIS